MACRKDSPNPCKKRKKKNPGTTDKIDSQTLVTMILSTWNSQSIAKKGNAFQQSISKHNLISLRVEKCMGRQKKAVVHAKKKAIHKTL